MALTLQITIFLLVFIISLLGTYLIRKFALRKNIIDIPNERSSHKVPTPRGGGLSFVIIWYLILLIAYISGYINRDLFWALLPGLILAVTGFLDDIYSIKPFIRLSLQLIVVMISLYSLKGFEGFHFHDIKFGNIYILTPIALIGMLWFINLYNFLDGIDAYASVEAIFIASTLFFFTGNFLLFFLAAAILGFLVLNWPKAKIFMGDVGSTQLGFIFIVFGIYFHNSTDFHFIYWLILTSVFWFDATVTLYRRWRNKEKLTEAHKKHAYQRIVQYGFTHLKTDLYLVGINLILLGIIVISIWLKLEVYIPMIISLIFLYGVIKLVDKRFKFKN